MDIPTCKAFCKSRKALYMGLKNSQDCHCGRSGVALGQPTHEKLKDSECQMACVGNADETCGGVSTKGTYVVSVHASEYDFFRWLPGIACGGNSISHFYVTFQSLFKES